MDRKKSYMNNKIPFTFLSLIILSLTLSSCVLTSKNPLGPESGAVVDKRLTGVWREKSASDSKEYLVITKGKENILKFIADSAEYQGYITLIDGEGYINFREVRAIEGKKKIGEEYILAHYSINSDNELLISLFNQDMFRQAIEGGKIKGDIIKGEWGYSVTLTDTSDNLRGFVEDHKNIGLLVDPVVFRRVGIWEAFFKTWLPGNWIYLTMAGVLALILFVFMVVMKRRY